MQLRVGQVEHAAEQVAELVVQRAAGRGRLPREPGACERGGARIRVARGPQRGADARREAPQPFARRSVGDRRRPRGPERLDTVRDRVHPARGGHAGRQVVGELGVVDDETRRDGRIAAGRLAPVLGHPPHHRQLGARVRRRNGGDREAFGQRNGLREADRRAAADRDQAVGLQLEGPGARVLGERSRDVHAHADDRSPAADRRQQTLGVARLRPPGDHERAPEPQPGELGGKARERARAEDDAAGDRLMDRAHARSLRRQSRSSGPTRGRAASSDMGVTVAASGSRAYACIHRGQARNMRA